MINNFDQYLALYDYTFPQESVALSPAHPRDSAKLLVFNRKNDSTETTTFAQIGKFLPERSVIVLNDTKVLPARMELKKNTGGAVSALYLRREGDYLRCLASGHLKKDDVLHWEHDLQFVVESREDKEVLLRPQFPIDDFLKHLQQFGLIPLPPYLLQSALDEKERQKEYQTVFASQSGAVAAPTAGLHFTPELLSSLKAMGHEIVTITLHVGLGTFAPLTEEQWQKKELHPEWYEISPETAAVINDAKTSHRPVVAVGTTVVRCLESAARLSPTLSAGQHTTTLFLNEDDKLQIVDHLITNFHIPKSSLLMLVAALTGRERLLALYSQAIASHYRLFSFGDAMLIL